MLLMYSPSKSYINTLTPNLHKLPKCSLKSFEPYNLKSNSLKKPKHLPLHLTFSSTPYLRNCQTYLKTSILIHLSSYLNWSSILNRPDKTRKKQIRKRNKNKTIHKTQFVLLQLSKTSNFSLAIPIKWSLSKAYLSF